jgi:uncharacterized protein (TIGR02246 family)
MIVIHIRESARPCVHAVRIQFLRPLKGERYETEGHEDAACRDTAALAAPAFAQDAKSITDELGRKYNQACKAGDAAALTALFTKDAVLLPQGVDGPLNGEANIRKYFDGALKPNERLVNLTAMTTEAKMLSSDAVVEAGTWFGDAPGQNGAPAMRVSGTYLVVDVRDGSDWRIRAITWNQMPPPPSK